MKKIFVLLTLGLSLLSCTQTKMAFIDVEEIMKEYKGTKEKEAEMKEKSDALRKELDSLASSWEEKARKYQQEMNALSAKTRAEREKVLMQEQQAINQRQQAIQQQVQSEGQAGLEEITNEIKDFLKTYANTNGIQVIFGTSVANGTIMYGDDAMDITDDVLVQLNKNYKSSKKE
ncbi:OmpH family outer membrane protein [Flavobacteriaceae bacterium F08102]|nr:OmpH family outer membrane protein [Flavobacteriaceae bacterium F08102]